MRPRRYKILKIQNFALDVGGGGQDRLPDVTPCVGLEVRVTSFARPTQAVVPSPFRVRADTLVLLAAGLLFVGAGTLKLVTPSVGTFDELPRAVGVIEALFGFWLVSGIGKRWSLPTCVVLFTGLAAYHAWKMYRGDTAPCGCFGAAANLSHGFLALVCVSGAGACVSVTRPLNERFSRMRLPAFAVQACFLVLSGWTLVGAIQGAAAAAPPRSWAQDALDQIPEAQRSLLRRGAWRVIFIDPACDKCQAVLAETASAYLTGAASERLLLVITGSNADAGDPLLSIVDAEVVSLASYTPPCLPTVLVLGDAQLQHTSCGGSASLPPQVHPHPQPVGL